MNINTRFVLLVLMSFSIVACAASYNEKNDINDINEPGALDLILCEEPRPKICAREYKPVCARFKDGHSKTYATGCNSCTDKAVVGYTADSC